MTSLRDLHIIAKRDLRELAVVIVDNRLGYTYEFAPSPAAHLYEYDLLEERLRSVTKRQREAFIWLEAVGKASEKRVRKAGFMPRTMEALVKAGLIEADDMPRSSIPFGSFRVYRSTQYRWLVEEVLEEILEN